MQHQECQMDAILDRQFAKDVYEMIPGGLFRYSQGFSNLAIGKTGCRQYGDVLFATGKNWHWGRLRLQFASGAQNGRLFGFPNKTLPCWLSVL